MTDTLVFADPLAIDDLGRFAGRARRLAPDGAMRLQAVGSVLAAWVAAREGSGILADGVVLGLRTMALASSARLDVTVPLAAVTDRSARPERDATFSIPPVTVFAPWTSLTPPREGWRAERVVQASDLGAAAADGIDAVSSALEVGTGRAATVRDEVWATPIAGSEPLTAGVAIGASALGFLAPDSIVGVSVAGPWVRATCSGGFIITR